VGELFRDAVRLNASGLILVHNHPSGDPTPSPDDLHLTAEALAAGRLLDIAPAGPPDHRPRRVPEPPRSWSSVRSAGTGRAAG